MFRAPGEDLLSLCQSAGNDVFLAAPFIKKEALKKVLAVIPQEVSSLTVVTRWVPIEIASGVSDLEVLDLLNARPNTQLLLHPCLHAKYYRIDKRCLVGSANITAKALGWSSTPNIELLIEANPEESMIRQLEAQLNAQSIVATESIRAAVQKEVEDLRLKLPELYVTEESQEDFSIDRVWLPVCIKPEYLYRIYLGQDTSNFLESVVSTGKNDINVLNVMPGLTEVDFRKYIAAVFERTPAAQEIHNLSKDSAITAEVAEAVIAKYREQLVAPTYDAAIYWQIFKAWLLYCFPQRYRIKPAAEVLEQAKEI